MKNYIILVILMFGCATVSPTLETKKNIEPKYKTGDCLMLVDPSTGNKPTRHRVKIEKINLQEGRYYYRWLLDSNKWDSGLSTAVGKFEVLERITQKVNDCP